MQRSKETLLQFVVICLENLDLTCNLERGLCLRRNFYIKAPIVDIFGTHFQINECPAGLYFTAHTKTKEL